MVLPELFLAHTFSYYYFSNTVDTGSICITGTMAATTYGTLFTTTAYPAAASTISDTINLLVILLKLRM